METLLVEKDFAKLTIDLENSLVKQVFFETQQDIQDEEFYEFMKVYVDNVDALAWLYNR